MKKYSTQHQKRNKKGTLFLFATILLGGTVVFPGLSPQTSAASDTGTEGLTYMRNQGDTGYTVIGCTTASKDIVIPSEWNGSPVTEIDYEAFEDDDVLQYITLPDTLEEIGSDAFKDCDELRYIEIPANVTRIGTDAFAEDARLQNIIFRGNAPQMGSDFYKTGTYFTPICYASETATGFDSGDGTFGGMRISKIPMSDSGCTVVYETNRGTTIAPTEGIARGSLLAEPSTPVRAGYQFLGWYCDRFSNTRWTFQSATVSSDMILYARWGEIGNKVYNLSIAGWASAYNNVALWWSRQDWAERYEVWRFDSRSGKFRKIADTSCGFFEDKGRTLGKMYKYKVRGYATVYGKKKVMSWSKTFNAKAILEAPDVTEKVLKTGKTKLSWKKVSHANGYKVYREKGVSGKFELIGKTSSLSFTDSKKKKKSIDYYYTVRAYAKTKYGTVLGAKSNEYSGESGYAYLSGYDPDNWAKIFETDRG